jgi:hypothetical protein
LPKTGIVETPKKLKIKLDNLYDSNELLLMLIKPAAWQSHDVHASKLWGRFLWNAHHVWVAFSLPVFSW